MIEKEKRMSRKLPANHFGINSARKKKVIENKC